MDSTANRRSFLKKNPGKFVAYSENVEVKGTVVANEDSNLFVMPDKNYLNLLAPGNYIAPKPGELGYQWYAENILGNRQAAKIPSNIQEIPIIKMEHYAICKNIACTEKFADAGGAQEKVPILRDVPILGETKGVPILDKTILATDSPCKDIRQDIDALNIDIATLQRELQSAPTNLKRGLIEQITELNVEIAQMQDNYQSCLNSPLNKGGARQVKPGDRIKVNGVYAIDNSHPMYYSDATCSGSFGSLRGLYVACYNHAEIHPYNPESISIIKPLQPGNTNVESHVVVAPIYTQFYSLTHLTTRLAGLAYHFVDDTEDSGVSAPNTDPPL